MVGFAVGIVERDDIIDGRDIKRGDILIGLASNGLHSNGYSLVRKVIFEIHRLSPRKRPKELDCTLGEELLKPTRIYTSSITKLLNRFRIKGIAHITGGGLTENLPRLLKRDNLRFIIEKDTWPVHGIFYFIQRLGDISEREMFKTFNMGIGLVLVVEESEKERILKALKRYGETAYIIGRVESGRRGVIYV
jgi:phosphoribosylformylglycinamidine cyclo-ligase